MLRTILAPNPSPMTLDGTRTFIVGRERPVVIDPGPEVETHLDAILAALGGISPAAILLTHAHADHAALAAPLAHATGAPVVLAEGGLGLHFDLADIVHRLDDGDAFETDAGKVRAVATPGHSADHVAFLWAGGAAPEGGALFAGDAFMGGADTVLVAPPEGDLGDYLETLDRVERLAPAVILPAHGPPIEDPAAAVARYRAHRRERIEQVVRALRERGPARPAELVGAVYGPGLHPGLRMAAEGSLFAILGYLVATGQVREEEAERYALI